MRGGGGRQGDGLPRRCQGQVRSSPVQVLPRAPAGPPLTRPWRALRGRLGGAPLFRLAPKASAPATPRRQAFLTAVPPSQGRHKCGLLLLSAGFGSTGKLGVEPPG